MDLRSESSSEHSSASSEEQCNHAVDTDTEIHNFGNWNVNGWSVSQKDNDWVLIDHSTCVRLASDSEWLSRDVMHFVTLE